MTITQLRYVLAVAEFQNFTRAAEKVAVTQPTLSMQIQKLEEELNVKIFDRDQKPISLTEVGEKIVEQAKNIVDESERIQDIVDQQKGFVGGDFKIGIIPTVMPTLLPMFLKNVIRKYPKLNLYIEEISTENLIEQLEEGHIDVGIAATPLENENLKERVLFYEPFLAYVPENHRLFKEQQITPDDLDVDDILLLMDGHCFKESVLNLCKAQKNQEGRNFQLQSGSFETLIRLADEGIGMTLLPYLNTLHLSEEKKKKLRPFKDPKPAREISIVYSKSKLKIHIIEALQEEIRGIIRGAIAFEDVEIISPIHRD